jgi:hypothetical protein
MWVTVSRRCITYHRKSKEKTKRKEEKKMKKERSLPRLPLWIDCGETQLFCDIERMEREREREREREGERER